MVAVAEPHRQKEEAKWTTGQRKFRRYLTTLPITVIVRERGFEGYCNQIAQGGLGAFLPEAVPVGSEILLQFVVPTHPSKLRVQAVVRYQIGFQHGFEFQSLNEAERLAIRQFCSELPSVSGP
jgi:hypothetical protein